MVFQAATGLDDDNDDKLRTWRITAAWVAAVEAGHGGADDAGDVRG